MTARKLTAFAAAGILAAACAPATTAQAQDRYEIDPTHTFVQFSVMRFGYNNMLGVFPDVKGVITLDEAAPENSSVEVEIGVTSLTSGNNRREEALQSPFWFNGEEFPMMTYRSVSVEQVSDNEAHVSGELTLMGVTKPITLRVFLNKLGKDPATKKDAVGFSATATLDRLDFGMKTAENLVGTEVAIRIETLAHKVAE